MMLGILLAIILTVSTWMTWYFRYRPQRRRMYELTSKMKKVPGIPILGNVLMWISEPSKIIYDVDEKYSMYGPNFATWLVHVPMIIIGRSEDVEIVLKSQSCLAKSFMYDMIKTGKGQGLIYAPVKIWKKTRKMITPAFNSKILQTFMSIFEETSGICTDECLAKVVNEKNVDWFKIIGNNTLDAFCQTAMGINLDVQRSSIQFVNCMDEFQRICYIRLTNILLHSNLIFGMTNMSKELKAYQQYGDNFAEQVIQQKKSKLREKSAEEAPVDDVVFQRKAFLDILLESAEKDENEFTDDYVREEIISLFVAGTDTSTTNACFFLMMMGMHADIQDKVYEEIISVLGPDRNPGWNDLARLDLLERCLMETLRLFPPGAIISREVNDNEVKLSDCVLPVGATILIPIYSIHRNPKYWENPLKFDPDRFSIENSKKRHPFSFIPFSGGLRGCIAKRYAYMNAKVLQCKILRKYKVCCDYYKKIEDIKLTNRLTIKPLEGYKFYFEKRLEN